MIHVVDQFNRHLYRDQLREMHRQRKAQLVDRLGWKLTVRDGGEYDAFDDDRALYFLALEPDRRVACSARLRPGDDGSIIASQLPHLVAPGERPLDDGRTFELSRATAAGSCRGPAGALRQAELRLAMLEASLARGCDRFVGFVDVGAMPLLDATGWIYRYIGPPAVHEGGTAIAFEVEVSERAIARKRRIWAIDYPVLPHQEPPTWHEPVLDYRPGEPAAAGPPADLDRPGS